MRYPFNVRVYGIVIDNNRILLSDEVRGDFRFTKFPGGGLEFGEGTKACLEREFKEELGVDVVDLEHLYTTDFFQRSAFNTEEQVISIYYLVKVPDPGAIKVTTKPFNFAASNLIFRWKSIESIKPEEFTFPIDQHLVKQLIN